MARLRRISPYNINCKMAHCTWPKTQRNRRMEWDQQVFHSLVDWLPFAAIWYVFEADVRFETIKINHRLDNIFCSNNRSKLTCSLGILNNLRETIILFLRSTVSENIKQILFTGHTNFLKNLQWQCHALLHSKVKTWYTETFFICRKSCKFVLCFFC